MYGKYLWSSVFCVSDPDLVKKQQLSFGFVFEVMLLASYVSIIIQQKYGHKSDFKKTQKTNHVRLSSILK